MSLLLTLITIYFQDLKLSDHLLTDSKADVAFERKKISTNFFNTPLLSYIIFRIEML